MTDDPEIISSGNPHEVHLPEGSHTAVHKTAVPMEPQVRQTIANPDEEVELIEIVQGVSKSKEEETRLAHGNPAADEAARTHHAQASAELPDRMVSDDGASDASNPAPSLAKPLDQVMSDLPSLDLPASDATSEPPPARPATEPEEPGPTPPPAQEAAAEADTSEKASEVATAATYMEEMSFPARVVKLKIANDQIRGQIEKLEKPLFPPVPVEAPAAKAKGKESDKKPAKGH